jgi:gamma-glutamyltranspeptidase/glutathione hydrolase
MVLHPRGVVAAGHPVTAQAAAAMLREGGNAFDAALAALFASCVAEPVLASLGGGGFLLAHTQDRRAKLFDFFTQTPRSKRPRDELDFFPILADFGATQQEFHIGLGSIAVPGVVRGAFGIHRSLCRMPIRDIIQPAIRAARDGVPVNGLQHYIGTIVAPILRSNADAMALHASPTAPGELAREGERVGNRALAELLDTLAREGADPFYRGEIAQRLARDSREHGGHLSLTDLARYRVVVREPLAMRYRGARILFNPPPSLGGTLIALALGVLEHETLNKDGAGGLQHLSALARAMGLIQRLRRERGIDRSLDARSARSLLDPKQLEILHAALSAGNQSTRGTTQISVADGPGNLASLTLSNGEGSGYVLPGTGIMLNNMLGEEDINPHGFHDWQPNRRLASMMSPTVMETFDGALVALGSGGSNRIRSAILQVIVGLVDLGQPLSLAVEAPRIHLEDDVLNVEAGLPAATLHQLSTEFPRQRIWPEKNLFFGGAHSIMRGADSQLSGRGDSRRGGVCLIV